MPVTQESCEISTAILEELQSRLKTRNKGRPIPHVVCMDGFTMSVQAGRGVYCSPRDDAGPWLSVEVGFPSKIEPLLWDYAEEPGRWTETVYGYVPIELVGAVIECHGGFASSWRASS